MEEFFKFSSKRVLSTVYAHAPGLKKCENGVDGLYNLIKGEYKGINFPVIFEQESGKKFTDILDGGLWILYLISERLRLVLSDNRLTGWKTFPIKLFDKRDNEILGYHGFSVVGHCGPLSYEQSEIIEKRSCPEGPVCKYYKGLYINNWDGSDFFTSEKNYGIFVTKKAGEILKENKLTNLELVTLLNYETRIDNIVTFDRSQIKPS